MLSVRFQKKSELLTGACKEEAEEKAQEKGAPPSLRTNPGVSGLVWLQPTLKIRPHDGTGKSSMNLYLYSAICAFFSRYTVLCCFLRTDLRVKFHTAPLCESSIKGALCTELNRQGREWELGMTLISGHLCISSLWSTRWTVISSHDQSSTFALMLRWGRVATELLCDQGHIKSTMTACGLFAPVMVEPSQFRLSEGFSQQKRRASLIWPTTKQRQDLKLSFSFPGSETCWCLIEIDTALSKHTLSRLILHF